MNTPRRTYIDGPHGQIHARYVTPDSGGGIPLICFHATPMSSRLYDAFMRRFDDRPVYALDTPGYGESDRPAAPLSIVEYAQSLAHAIDALGLSGPIDLMGMHTGTRLAVEIALGGKTNVRRLIFVGCALYTPEERAASAQWSYDMEIPKPEDTGGAQITRLWKNFEDYRRDGVTDAMLERLMSDVLRDRAYSSWAHVGVYAHDLASRLPLLDQPVLVINADDDLHGPTQRAPALLKNGRIADMSPAGFNVLEAFPDRCADIVRAFLDE